MRQRAELESPPSIPILNWSLNTDDDLISLPLRFIDLPVSSLLLPGFRHISCFRREKQRDVRRRKGKELVNHLQVSSLFVLMFSPFSNSFFIYYSNCSNRKAIMLLPHLTFFTDSPLPGDSFPLAQSVYCMSHFIFWFYYKCNKVWTPYYAVQVSS